MACREDRDCPNGLRCRAAEKPANFCLADDQVRCPSGRDRDCVGNLVCGPDLTCRDACRSSRDCVSGQVCAAGFCADRSETSDAGVLSGVDGGGAGCTSNSECSAPLVCEDRRCVPQCRSDGDCNATSTCAPSGTCIPRVEFNSLPGPELSGTGEFDLQVDAERVAVSRGGVTSFIVKTQLKSDPGPISLGGAGPAGLNVALRTVSGAHLVVVSADSTSGERETSVALVGVGTTGERTLRVPVSVRGSPDVLLLDDDQASSSSGGRVGPGADDVMRGLLADAGVPFDVFLVPASQSGPDLEQIMNYQTLVWYCGAGVLATNWTTLTGADEAVLMSYLDQPDHRLVLMAPNYPFEFSGTWTSLPSRFINDYLGVSGIHETPDMGTFRSTGRGLMDGLVLSVATDGPEYPLVTALNPAAGTEMLFTIRADPALSGMLTDTAIATARRQVGEARASSVLFLGFPFANVVDIGGNTKREVLRRLLAPR